MQAIFLSRGWEFVLPEMTAQGSLKLRARHFHAVIQEAKLYI